MDTTLLYSSVSILTLIACTAFTHFLPKGYTVSTPMLKIHLTTAALVAAATVAYGTVMWQINREALKLLGITTASISEPVTLAGVLLVVINFAMAYNFWLRWVNIPVRDLGCAAREVKKLQIKKQNRLKHSAKIDQRYND